MFVAVLPVAAAGCLNKEVTETWYLEADGAVTWTVIEKDVRSDAQAAGDRQDEETNYIGAVRVQDHPIFRGLRQLGPVELRTRILRATVPFTVTTEAKFANLADLGRHVIERSGLGGTSVVERTTDGYEWTLTMRDPHAVGESARTNDDLNELFNGMEHLTIMLAEGRFLTAQGFSLSSDHRNATLAGDDDRWEASDDNGPVVLKLRWKAGR